MLTHVASQRVSTLTGRSFQRNMAAAAARRYNEVPAPSRGLEPIAT